MSWKFTIIVAVIKSSKNSFPLLIRAIILNFWFRVLNILKFHTIALSFLSSIRKWQKLIISNDFEWNFIAIKSNKLDHWENSSGEN